MTKPKRLLLATIVFTCFCAATLVGCGGDHAKLPASATSASASPTMSMPSPHPNAVAPVAMEPTPAASPTDRPTPTIPSTTTLVLVPSSTPSPAVASSGAGVGTPNASVIASASSVRAIAAAGTPTVVGTPAADSTVQAIETVVLQSNLSQMKAFANGNPSAMKTTATSSFYQQMVQSNQSLASAGGTSVQLLQLTWGPVSVQGTTAQVTTYETWLTTYRDGATELQEADMNVYDVLQSNGQWLVQSDNHPNDQSPPAGGPTSRRPTPAATPPAAVTPSNDTSRNWAGYSATGGGYTGVAGTWLLPQVNAQGAATPATDASWVGIGGVTTRDLIQAGSQAEVVGNGDVVYSTWIEMLPAPPTTVPLSVLPGDSLTVAIDEPSPGTWSVKLTDNTTGKNYETTVRYQSSNSSAEWVEEAGSSRRRVIPLDNFGTVAFTNATAVRNGKTADLAQLGASPITMAGPNGQPQAVPSGIGGGGSSFEVKRT